MLTRLALQLAISGVPPDRWPAGHCCCFQMSSVGSELLTSTIKRSRAVSLTRLCFGVRSCPGWLHVPLLA